MKLGIVGLPGAGKTTIFNALTKGDAPVGQSMGGRFDVLTAVVDVLDERVDVLSAMFKPKKTTYTRITYTDVAGLKKGANESGAMSGELLNHLSGLDGFVHVVRAFESDLHPHPDGSVDPARDLEALDTEFLLNDLAIVERRMEKLESGIPRNAFKNKAEAIAELELFKLLNETLTDERPLRTLEITPEQDKLLRGYGLLTLKPTVIIFNIGDDQPEIILPVHYPHTTITNLRGKLEMELAQLSAAGDQDSVDMFMEEYGVTELSLDKIIRLSYDLMGLQSFFTVGEDEVRAWTVERGATAPEAAGVIHSDLQKGFIRAETVHYDDLIGLGGMAQVRAAGKLRQEGKTYIIHDGDIINVKFNL
jgi:GTP-binding protein YchF